MKGIRPEGWRAEENPNKVSPEVLSRSVQLRPRRIRCRRFVFFWVRQMYPKGRSPISIDFACFIKCLDKVAVVLVNSPMLARRLDHPPRRKSFPYILLQPLCALFSSAALSFQSLAASFRKTPGVGVLHKSVLCYQQLPDSSSREVQTGGTAISGCRSQVFKGMSRRSTPRRPSLCGLP